MRRFFISSVGAFGVVIISCLATLWAMGQVLVTVANLLNYTNKQYTLMQVAKGEPQMLDQVSRVSQNTVYSRDTHNICDFFSGERYNLNAQKQRYL